MRRKEAGQGRRWGCGPEQLVSTVPCVNIYSGCIAMARIHNIIRRRTQLLAVFCKIFYNTLGATAGVLELYI